MKIMNIQIAVCKIGSILLITTLASSVVFCAPAQQQSTTTTSANTNQKKSTFSTQRPASSTTTTTAASATATTNNGRQLSSVASELSSMPSLVSLRDTKTQASGQASNNHYDESSTFDGENPFTDDSLWQIPIHLVRDTSAYSSGPSVSSASSLSKSTNEMSSADEHDDVMDDIDSTGSGSILDHQQQQPKPSASSSPTVISASTDLKTAAGYHHPTPHHYGGHQDAGHYGGGHHGGEHHGGDHYGKYFQYASVPYPYAWDFGYRRGNPYHTIERYEHGKGPHFQTKVKWSDKHGGYGVHVWDYNHDDHHSHHYGGGDHGHGYDSHGPSHYSGAHHGGHYGHH